MKVPLRLVDTSAHQRWPIENVPATLSTPLVCSQLTPRVLVHQAWVISLRADGLVVFVPQLHVKALLRLQRQDGTLALPSAFLGARRDADEEARGTLVMEARSLRVRDENSNITLASFELLQRVRALPLSERENKWHRH